ncbi:prostatic acid phosphatase isoform X2 [Ascaphus truei]|uniref:prostatic acid phosphatase isoform X2 n=1 Tax=Ascaphus truei TaxID=8439 RepID=UPI003F5915E4
MKVISSGCLPMSCYFFLNLFFLLMDQTIAGRKLKFVTLVYRHGDRSPIEAYPHDIHKEDSWNSGFGQLTQLGQQQQYELGQYLKKRYAGFISPSYNQHEVYIRSTDYNRTLMSAQSNLAGLFSSDDEQVWNPNIVLQPIPVHSVPLAQEKLLYMPFKNCALYEKLKKDTYLSKKFQRRVAPYVDSLPLISQNTGYTLKELYHGKAWTTYDTLFCERIHNFTLPEWATKETMAKLLGLAELSLSFAFGLYKQTDKSRLQGGVLVKAILTNITHITTAPSSPQKLIMYSAHDTTLAALQTALNVSNGRLPPYAACHIFELYQEKNGKYSIEMYYRNDSSVDPYPLTLPGCTSSCPYQKFIELTSPIIVKDWEKACAKSSG